jgi:acetoacetyl-CoA synthetase
LVVRIRREVARRASPLHVPDLIAAVPELPRTHSGKRSERAARDAAAGRAPAAPGALANPESLAAVARAVGDALARRRELERRPSPDRVTATGGCTEQAVRSIWESVLGVTLEPDDDFFELGGTSLQAIRVLAAIDDLLGVELAPSTLIDARTPAAMAAAIDGRASGELGRRVLMRAGKGGPIVVLHPIAGSVLQLYELVRALDTDRPVYGIQAVGLEPGVEPQTQVDQMADTYVAWLEELGLPGPYALVGYSFGALLALECARRLSARNIEVDSLVLIEPRMHHRSERWPRRVWLGSRRHLLELRARAAWRLARARDLPASGEPPTLPDRMQLVERASRQARRDYRPGALSADAIVFLCDGRQPGYFDPLPLLRRVIRGRMVIEPIDGTHDDAVSGPNVRTLASRMSDYLRPSWRSPLRAVPDA